MQIVGYDTAPGDGPAALVLAEDGIVERQGLDADTELSYTLETRHCAGEHDDGTHHSCSREKTPYCELHTSRWPCARCTGDCAMPIEACHEEHALYLAAFDSSTVKVGVTRSWRLEERLREQGAKRAAHLRTVENGRIARRIEAALTDRFPDRVRVPTKIAALHRTVDDEEWESAIGQFDPIETYTFDYGFTLDRRPVPETIATGTVVGTQGRILVLERGGTVYGVDLRDLVGYEVSRKPSSRAVQSSFGSFE